MKIIAIIPARMGSTRFPGKPLAPIHGMPMIGHVALRTAMAKKLTACYVATCDEVIKNYCQNMGINVVMTSNTHTRCSSRVAEALGHIENHMGESVDIVVMVQGDEPMVTPQMIDASLDPMLNDPSIQIVNLMTSIDSHEEFNNPNTIKVVCDNTNKAIYFSRLPIPSSLHGTPPDHIYKQVCIIPFRRNALINFEKLSPTSLELAESIDMLRLMEHGHSVHMVKIDFKTQSVDTPDDLTLASKLMEHDPLMLQYINILS